MKKRGKDVQEQIRAFVKQYGRKAQKGVEPNDRRYDRKIEALVKRMSPAELDAILSEQAPDDEASA